MKVVQTKDCPYKVYKLKITRKNVYELRIGHTRWKNWGLPIQGVRTDD